MKKHPWMMVRRASDWEEDYRGGSGKKKVLFFTNSEAEQADVVLATAYEMLLSGKYEIHIASFRPLQSRMKEFNALLPASLLDDFQPAVFDTIFGPTQLEAIAALDEHVGPYPPGVRGALKTYRTTLPTMATYAGTDDYLAGYENCLRVIRSVHPSIIISDPLMSQGLDACKTMGRKVVVLTSNTFLEIVRSQQSFFRQFCSYPAIASAFSYSVPWYLIPINIFLNLAALLIFLTSSKLYALMSFRTAHDLPPLPPSFSIYSENNHYIVPSLPETDLPCSIPDNVTACGPITLPTVPVTEAAPELAAWLHRAPTVFVDLGSCNYMTDTQARQLAGGLKMFMTANPKIQVLWKLNAATGISTTHNEKRRALPFNISSLSAVGVEMAADRARVLQNLPVSTLSILESGNIIASIHHGCANFFNEALSTGVPQIVLPSTFETIDSATRVEYLGIGIWGSRKAAPGVEARELASALERVTSGEESLRLRRKAKELAFLCSRAGGRQGAAREIEEMICRGRFEDCGGEIF